MLAEDFGDNFRFTIPRVVRQLPHGCLEVGKHLIRRCLVHTMELAEFLHNRVRLPHGRVFHGFVSSDAGKTKAAELLGYFHSNGSLINSSGPINIREATVITAMAD